MTAQFSSNFESCLQLGEFPTSYAALKCIDYLYETFERKFKKKTLTLINLSLTGNKKLQKYDVLVRFNQRDKHEVDFLSNAFQSFLSLKDTQHS